MRGVVGRDSLFFPPRPTTPPVLEGLAILARETSCTVACCGANVPGRTGGQVPLSVGGESAAEEARQGSGREDEEVCVCVCVCVCVNKGVVGTCH